MADAVLDSAGKNVTIADSQVSVQRNATLDMETIAGGDDIVGDITHEGIRILQCVGRLATAADIDKIDDLVQNGTAVTFTSDLQALFTTNAIGNVFVTAYSCNYRDGNLEVTVQMVEDTGT